MNRMDPRIAARRRAVQESHARRNLGRLFVLLGVAVVAAGTVWAFRSPMLSLADVTVEGAVNADVNTPLAQLGIVEGVPLMDVDVEAAATAIQSDPWVISALVARDWPNALVVTVSERRPIGWVRTPDTWQQVAVDGGVVATSEVPEPGWPVLVAVNRAAADYSGDPQVRGMLEFMAALRPDLADTAVIREVEGGFDAIIGGFDVRLGTGDRPSEKAAAVAVMIDRGLEEGSVITVMAPDQPAVLAPGAADVDSQSEAGGEGSDADPQGD